MAAFFEFIMNLLNQIKELVFGILENTDKDAE